MNYELKVVIWGLGRIGKNLIDILGVENIAAIIESDTEKLAQGNYLGIPIIDFDIYVSLYNDAYIVITPMKYQEIESELRQNGIKKFFTFNRCKVKSAVLLEITKDKFIVENKINIDKRIFVCGEDFSAIYIFLYLKRKDIAVRYVNFSARREKILTELVYDGIIDGYFECFPDESDVYVIATDREKSSFEHRKCSILDYNELNKNVYSRWQEELRKFKNLYNHGERVFIVATGPSLQIADVEKLRDNCEITMSINYIYRLFDETDWRPDYYVISDGTMMREYEKASIYIKNFDDVIKFFSDSYLEFWENSVDDTYYGYSVEYNSEGIRFSSDCSETVYSGKTVIYICLQIAVYMGFKEIYLLGCDFDYTSGNGSHFYTDQNYIVDFDYEFVQKAYLEARKYAEQHGIKIYNATRGGKLEVFERRDFDKLLFKH